MDLKIANASVDSVKIAHKKPPLYAVPAGTEIALFKLEEWEKIEKSVKKITGHRFSVRSIKWINDNMVASGGKDGILMIHNSSDGSLEFSLGQADVIIDLDIVDEKIAVATASVVSVWDWKARKKIATLEEIEDTQKEQFTGVTMSPESNYVAVTTNKGRIIVYNLAKGKKSERKYIQFSTKPVIHRKHILVGTMDGRVLVLNLSGKKVDYIPVSRDYGPPSYILPVSEHEILVGTWKGPLLRIALKKKKIITELTGHVGPITGMVLRNELLYTGAQDGTVRVWNLAKGNTVKLFKYPRPIQAIDVSPDNKIVAIGTVNPELLLWEPKDISTPEFLRGHDYLIYSIAWSPDMKLLASASGDATAKIWNPFEKKEVKTFVGHSESVFAVCWDPKGNYIATGSPDKTLRVWDVKTGNCILIMEHGDTVYSVAWSPNGKYIATGSPEGVLSVWDSVTGILMAQLTLNEWIDSLEWTPDNEYVIVNNKLLVYVIE